MSRKAFALATGALCMSNQVAATDVFEAANNTAGKTPADHFKDLSSLWDSIDQEIENYELVGNTDW